MYVLWEMCLRRIEAKEIRDVQTRSTILFLLFLFPFSFSLFFHSECSCGNLCVITASLTVNPVLDNKLLYSSKSRSFSLDSTCAYCYQPIVTGRGQVGAIFPL